MHLVGKDGIFHSAEAKNSFYSHLSKAHWHVRTGAKTGIILLRLFGKKLSKIPLLKKIYGPVQALVAMHNESPIFNSLQQADHTQSVKCQFTLESIDLVVAGSGPGGAITALESLRNGETVLCVESGDDIDPDLEHHTPAQMSEHFLNGGQEVILSMSPIAFAQGFAWGGGSEINSGLFHSTPAVVEEKWRKANVAFTPRLMSDAATSIKSMLKVEAQEVDNLGIYGASPILDMQENLKWDGGVIPRWRKYNGQNFKHFGMASTYLTEASKLGLVDLKSHKVVKFVIDERDDCVIIDIEGAKCRHKVKTKKLALSAGALKSPEIIANSGYAKSREFAFNFHAMLREAVLYERLVNDLHDIDPHQIWSSDNKYKIGAAVGTPGLLASTLASKGIASDLDFGKIATYYISIPYEGRAGLVRLGNALVPYVLPSKHFDLNVTAAAQLLRNAAEKSGGVPLGEVSKSMSTVHVFGSMPLGKSKVVDAFGFLRGSGGRVFVRDASILPTAPLVNPQGPLMQLVTCLEILRHQS